MKVLSFNIQFILRGKKDLLYCYLKNKKIDVGCFQETWLQPQYSYRLRNYEVIRKDRAEQLRGGILVCIKKSLMFQKLAIEEITSSKIDMVACQMDLPIDVLFKYLL